MIIFLLFLILFALLFPGLLRLICFLAFFAMLVAIGSAHSAMAGYDCYD